VFSRAKDAMVAVSDIPEAPWWVIEADVKKRARLNVMTHLLGQCRTRTSPPRRPTCRRDRRSLTTSAL
jgi:polyphosphate kinase 2 (PPK2 family)